MTTYNILESFKENLSIAIFILILFFSFILLSFKQYQYQIQGIAIIVLTGALVIINIKYVQITKSNVENTKENVEITKEISDRTEKRTKHQALIKLQEDFRSPEMYFALKSLWNFYNKTATDNKIPFEKVKEIIEKMKEKYKEEEIPKIKNIIENNNQKPNEKKLEIEFLLDYQRRIISHFYQSLNPIIKNGILSGKELYPNFGHDLHRETVKKIIIPLEETIFEDMKKTKPHLKDKQSPSLELLNDLETILFNQKPNNIQ